MYRSRSSGPWISVVALVCLLHASIVSCCLPGSLLVGAGSLAHAADCPSGAESMHHNQDVPGEDDGAVLLCPHDGSPACAFAGEQPSFVTFKPSSSLDARIIDGGDWVSAAHPALPAPPLWRSFFGKLSVHVTHQNSIPLYLMTARIRI